MMEASNVNPWDAVKTAVPLSSYIAKHSGDRKPMRKTGEGKFMAFCPLHPNDKTPSMSIDDKKGVWHCFAGCGGGTIIDFWVAASGVDIANEGVSKEQSLEAVKALAQELSLTIDFEKQGEYISVTKIKEAIKVAIANMHEFLLEGDSKEADAIWEYAADRGLDRDDTNLIDLYMLGALPSREGEYLEILTDGKTSNKEVLAAGGLLNRNDRGQFWSPFYGRLIIPIATDSSTYVGIAGRMVDAVPCYKRESAKWINPVETQLFQKRKILFGQQDLPKNPDIQIVVVEGYFDAMAITHGKTEVPSVGVAVCGTSLSRDHASIIKRFPSASLMFDGDDAGYKALLRSLWIVQSRPEVGAVILEGEDHPDPFDLFSRNETIPVVGSPILRSVIHAASTISDSDERFDSYISNALSSVDSRNTRNQLLELAAEHRGVPQATYSRQIKAPTQNAAGTSSNKKGSTKTPASVFISWLLQNPDSVELVKYTVARSRFIKAMRACFPDANEEELELLKSVVFGLDLPQNVSVRLNLEDDVDLSSLNRTIARALGLETRSGEALEASWRASQTASRTHARDDVSGSLETLLLNLENAQILTR